MGYPAIRSSQEHGLDCFLLSLRPSLLFSFLRHDPRSSHWKSLTPWVRGIYETKQRETKQARIAALDDYIINRMMDPQKFGALPPISVIQFQPFDATSLTAIPLPGVGNVMYSIEDSDAEVDRVLIDGLARVTAGYGVRERLQVENPQAFEQFNNSFRFTVALYVPTEGSLSPDIAGQLFADFNSYAWPVPAATTVANDIYNPYRNIARKVGDSDVLRRHGGLKIGKSKLGSKDVNFTTEVTMAQFCKIVIEGPIGYGSLNKPLPNAKISGVNHEDAAKNIIDFLGAFEGAMGTDRFAQPNALFRTAHGFYALGMLLHDINRGLTTQGQAVPALAAIDWSWGNPDFQTHIGRSVPGKGWYMNTGHQTITWLAEYCRIKCGVVARAAVVQAA